MMLRHVISKARGASTPVAVLVAGLQQKFLGILPQRGDRTPEQTLSSGEMQSLSVCDTQSANPNQRAGAKGVVSPLKGQWTRTARAHLHAGGPASERLYPTWRTQWSLESFRSFALVTSSEQGPAKFSVVPTTTLTASCYSSESSPPWIQNALAICSPNGANPIMGLLRLSPQPISLIAGRGSFTRSMAHEHLAEEQPSMRPVLLALGEVRKDLVAGCLHPLGQVGFGWSNPASLSEYPHGIGDVAGPRTEPREVEGDRAAKVLNSGESPDGVAGSGFVVRPIQASIQGPHDTRELAGRRPVFGKPWALAVHEACAWHLTFLAPETHRYPAVCVADPNENHPIRQVAVSALVAQKNEVADRNHPFLLPPFRKAVAHLGKPTRDHKSNRRRPVVGDSLTTGRQSNEQ